MRTTVTPIIEMAVASFLLGLATPAVCAQSAPAPLTRDQSAQIRKIEGRLMAPAATPRPSATTTAKWPQRCARRLQRWWSSGKSEQEIITYYRAKYGETILVVPDGMSGGLLTFTPVMIFVASTGLLLFFIRRSTSARDVTVPQLLPNTPEAEMQGFKGGFGRKSEKCGDCSTSPDLTVESKMILNRIRAETGGRF